MNNRTPRTVTVALAAIALVVSPILAGDPSFEDIPYESKPVYDAPGFTKDYGFDKDPNAYGTDQWDKYVEKGYDPLQYDQYDQYDQYVPYDQYDQYVPYDQYDQYVPYDQYDQYVPYDQYDQYVPYDQYDQYVPYDQYDNHQSGDYDYFGRHPRRPRRRSGDGYFRQDFGRRFLWGTGADTGGYLIARGLDPDKDVTWRSAGGAVVGSGIENFLDYAGNRDRQNDPASRVASNAFGYGIGNVAYRGISGDSIKGRHVAGGFAEGAIVGFGKYQADEQPDEMSGFLWGGLTRFAGGAANRAISKEDLGGEALAGEGLRALIGAFGYSKGQEIQDDSYRGYDSYYKGG